MGASGAADGAGLCFRFCVFFFLARLTTWERCISSAALFVTTNCSNAVASCQHKAMVASHTQNVTLKPYLIV